MPLNWLYAFNLEYTACKNSLVNISIKPQKFTQINWFVSWLLWATFLILPKNYDEDAATVMERAIGYTMIPNDSLYAVVEAVRYISQWNIPGSFVECGVWRGGATMCAALTLKQQGDTERLIYLYDTFTGMTEPKEVDTLKSL